MADRARGAGDQHPLAGPDLAQMAQEVIGGSGAKWQPVVAM